MYLAEELHRQFLFFVEALIASNVSLDLSPCFRRSKNISLTLQKFSVQQSRHSYFRLLIIFTVQFVPNTLFEHV